MTYRAEIDGLRAIAVIPVVLFHAGFERFAGGYVGVDVFFVISGYLITTIILSEKEKGTFSLVDFYERRARRILPALFLVLLASVPFAWLWLLPADMKDFSQSLIAVSTFSSNILFWRQTGYWGVDNALKPLLHTWSLAVEEQYYLLFPVFAVLMWKLGRRWILGSFVLIAGISLMVSQWGAYNAPVADFFLLPTRAWELAIGASIAYCSLFKKREMRTLLSQSAVNEAMSIIGLVLIAVSVFAFDEAVPFPSFFALLPTVGTGLIILFSSPDTLVGRLLGAKILVGIGLISYSAYLWHHVLFAFARHRSLTEPSDLLLFALAVLAFPLAYLSWRFLETPIRRKNLLSRNVVFLFGAAGLVLFLSIGMTGHLTDGFSGFPLRDRLTADEIEERLRVNYGLSKTCEGGILSPDCRTSEEPEILVWGDSYAMHLVQGIAASSPEPRIEQMTKSFCGPFFDIAPVSAAYPVSWAKGCLAFTAQVRDWIKESNTVKYVVVSSPFLQYLSDDSKMLHRDGSLEDASLNTAIAEFNKTLGELELMGVVPVVFSPPPSNGTDLGRCLAKAEWRGLPLDVCNFDVSEIQQDRVDVYHFLEDINRRYRVLRLDDLICDGSQCLSHMGSIWTFRDMGHLSLAGSAALGVRDGFYSMIVGDE